MGSGIVVRLRRTNAGMEISPTFNSVLERIDSELRLELLANTIGLAKVAPRGRFGDTRSVEQVLPDFEIGELIRGGKCRAGVRLPLGLHDFSQGFVGHAALSIVARQSLAGEVPNVKHQSVLTLP